MLTPPTGSSAPTEGRESKAVITIDTASGVYVQSHDLSGAADEVDVA